MTTKVLTVVIADDEALGQANTMKSLTEIFTALEMYPRFLIALSANELFDQAMKGKDGKMVDLVVLDGSYIYAVKEEDWMVSFHNREQFANGAILAEMLYEKGFNEPIVLVSTIPRDYNSDKFSIKVGKYDLWKTPKMFINMFRSQFT